MDLHDLGSLGPLEKLFQVWDEWGEEIETLPIEEVDRLLAEMGINPERTISVVRDIVKAENTKESQGGRKGKDAWKERRCASKRPEVFDCRGYDG